MSVTNSAAQRGFYIGLAIGQIWLAVVSTASASILWVLGQNPLQVSLILMGTWLIGLFLFMGAINLLKQARRLPSASKPEDTARSRKRGRKMGLLFGLVVLAEVIIIGGLNTLLALTNHGDWIVPVTYFIVGLHFIPLAFVFRVRPYIILGILWILVNLATIVFVPASLVFSQGVDAWTLFPIAGCGLVSWPIVASILWINSARVRQAAHSSVTVVKL